MSAFSPNGGKYGPEKIPHTDTFYALQMTAYETIVSCFSGCLGMFFHNLGQNVVEKFTKFSKIGVSVECFIADLLQLSSATVTTDVWFLGGRLGTCYQL